MKKLLIFLFLCFSVAVSAQQIPILLPGDNTNVSLGKLNRLIYDFNAKLGATYYVVNYGFTGDGVTDDGPAIQRMMDAAPTKSRLIFPNGKQFAILTPVYTEKVFYVDFGFGEMILSTNITGIEFNVKDGVHVENLRITGSGRSVVAKDEQTGLKFNAGTKHIIHDIWLEAVSGAGIQLTNNYGESITLSQTGNLISNIHMSQCNIGIATLARSEYNDISIITGYECAIVILDNSGNNTIDGFSMEGNTIAGLKQVAGNNVGHGSLSNGVMNHHTTAYGIWSNANGTGLTVSNVAFFQTHSLIENGGKDFVFIGCRFDGSATAGGITFDGATTTGNILVNCRYTIAANDPKTDFIATNSAKFTVVDMTRVDGAVFNFGNYTSTLLAAKTANYTLNAGDNKWVIKFDCTSGALTATLPAAADFDGQTFTLMKIDASANAMILDQNGSETINGSTSSISITRQYEQLSVQAYGGTWIRLGSPFDLAGAGTSGYILTSNGATSAPSFNAFTGINNTSATDVVMVGTDYNNSGGSYKIREGATDSKQITRALGSGTISTTGDGVSTNGLLNTSTLPNNTIIIIYTTLAIVKSDGSEVGSIYTKSTWRKDNSAALTLVTDKTLDTDENAAGTITFATTNSGSIIQGSVTRTGTTGNFRHATYVDYVTHSY